MSLKKDKSSDLEWEQYVNENDEDFITRQARIQKKAIQMLIDQYIKNGLGCFAGLLILGGITYGVVYGTLEFINFLRRVL